MLNDKDIKILSILYQKNQALSLKELAIENKLSERSIRNYIDRINTNFNFECIDLHLGICNIKDRPLVKEFLDSCNLYYFSNELITKYMLYKVAIDDCINLSHIAEKFEISRTSAKNYLSSLKDYLVKYHLKVEHNPKKGLLLLGKEVDKRKLLISLLLKYDKLDTIEKRTLLPLVDIYLDEYYKKTVEILITKLRKSLSFSLSQDSYKTLFYYFITVILRIKNKIILESNLNKNFIKNCTEYKVIKPLLATFQTSLNISIPEDEVIEIVNIVIGLNYSNNRETDYTNWFEYDLFISKIIQTFSKLYKINLVDDYELYDNLLNHIKPAMYRISNKIKLSNFDHNYIIKNANKEYLIVKEILIDLNFFPKSEYFKNYDEEIALITLHFKAAVDRNFDNNKRQKNVLVVCSFGYGTSKLIMKKISSMYDVNKIDTIALYQLENTDISKYDLLISAVGDEKIDANIPIIQISPILIKNDFDVISEHLTLKKQEKYPIADLNKILEKYIDKSKIENIASEVLEKFSDIFFDDSSIYKNVLLPIENIILEYDCVNIKEAISKAADMLITGGFINETYKRELILAFDTYGDYMMIDEDVAIPHTKNEGNVFKTGFTFIRFKNPIIFNDKKISLLFTFCSANNKDHLDSLITISNILKEKSYKNNMLTLKTPIEIIEFLNSNYIM